ncbi:probable transcription factor At1g11510 [Camellia sinensis]|uniref:probable transcription factor At1g11510 n=1 Tax=Camellia sinensis TaxID=4442 RepID=UPI0010367F8D|nr:probable transcription factor At1g11510 [Camellia sinensis]
MANNGLPELEPSSKKLVIAQTSTPNPQSSFKDDSSSKSDTSPTNPRIKPLASKPMGEDPPKVTNKPRSKLGSAKFPMKRLAASENNSNQESKMAKKKVVDSDIVIQKDSAKKTGDDTKKQLFQSLWNEEDEIVILKGTIEYTVKKGLIHSQISMLFIISSIYRCTLMLARPNCLKKVRRLNKKYENNASKSKMGKDRTFRSLMSKKRMNC